MDYAALKVRYGNGIDCPPDFSFPTSVMDSLAASQPTKLAIHWVPHDFDDTLERKISFAELSDLTHRAAVAFSDLGFRKGDRVMMQLGRRVEWWIILFGLMRFGAVPIPGTSLLVAKGPSIRACQTQPSLSVIHPDLKTRAIASKAVAFIGDENSCKVFARIAADVGIPLERLVQARADGKAVERPFVDIMGRLTKVEAGRRWTETVYRKEDLVLICEGSLFGLGWGERELIAACRLHVGHYWHAKNGGFESSGEARNFF